MKKISLIPLVMSFMFAVASNLLFAAPLGSQVVFNDLQLQSDGNIVSAGYAIIGGVSNSVISRHTTAGGLDATFGTGGSTVTLADDATVSNSLAIQSDGNIVVVGYSTASGSNHIFLARYTTAGALDTTFNGTGIVTTDIDSSDYSQANDIVIQSDGKIVIAGVASFFGSNQFVVARYNTNGSLDTTFNSSDVQPGVIVTSINVQALATSVGLQSTGEIIAAGTSFDGTNYLYAVAGYTSSGTLDTSFGTSGVTTLGAGSIAFSTDSIVKADDSILLGAKDGNDFTIVAFNSDGSVDTSFGISGIGTISYGLVSQANRMLVQADGNIVLVGASVPDVQQYVTLARFTSTGAADTTFGTGGILTTALGFNSAALGVVQQTDSDLVICGFSDNNPVLVCYLLSGLRDVTFGIDGVVATPNGSVAFPSIMQSITFNAANFAKDGVTAPDTNFDTVYSASSPLIALYAWQVPPSSSTQEPLTIEFDVPVDIDTTWAPTIELKFFVENNGASGVMNVRARADFKPASGQLGLTSPATGFVQTVTTGDVTVSEPVSGNLSIIRSSLLLNPTTPITRNVVVVVVDRVATTGTEYPDNIYLASMVFRYRKILS